MTQTSLLNYVSMMATQLKWAWDYLVYQSFFQPYNGLGLVFPELVDDLGVTRYENSAENGSTVECAVCLCKIEDGDEVRELSCNHIFHRVCLDRWLGYGHSTCPLCRNNVKPPRLAVDGHQEVILLNLCATGSRDRCTWWLR